MYRGRLYFCTGHRSAPCDRGEGGDTVASSAARTTSMKQPTLKPRDPRGPHGPHGVRGADI